MGCPPVINVSLAETRFRGYHWAMERPISAAMLWPMAIGSLLLLGCGGPIADRAVEKQMLHASLERTLAGDNSESPYKNLAVVMAFSDNSKKTIETMRKASHSSFSQFDSAVSSGDDPEDYLVAPFDGYRKLLSRDFKSVKQVDRVDQAAALNPDLVVVVDVYADLHPYSGGRFTTLKFDSSMIFLAPQRGELETFTAKTAEKVNKNCRGAGGPLYDCIRYLARSTHEEAIQQLESTLLQSEKLRDFAQSIGKSAANQGVAAAPGLPADAALAHPYHSDVDHPTYNESDIRANDFALVIGIDKYDTLPPADFAEHDAQAVRDHLLAMGYQTDHVVFLTGRRATRANMAKNIESWLTKNVSDGSTVFFYFSGHGAPDTATGAAYLVPWDGDPKALDQTAYPVGALYEKLGSLGAKSVIVAMDACFSGAGGRSVLPKGARPLVNRIDLGTAKLHGPIVALAASGKEEITGTDDAQSHGLFTYYLLKGLNEMGGSHVTAKKLFDYLRPKVEQAARRDNRIQTPQLIAESESSWQIRIK